jgi:hypothetical protein
MRLRLVFGCLLAAASFLVVALLVALLLAVAIPTGWRADSRVEVDWTEMPIEATGDERGLIGEAMKALMSGDSGEFEDWLATDDELQAELRITESSFRESVQVSSSTGSDGDLLTIAIVARSPDPDRCLAVSRAAAERTADLFQSYRWLEGTSQFASMSRQMEYSGSGSNGFFWLALLSAASSDPITTYPAKQPERDKARSVRVAVVSGFLAGILAASCVVGLTIWTIARRGRSPAPLTPALATAKPEL